MIELLLSERIHVPLPGLNYGPESRESTLFQGNTFNLYFNIIILPFKIILFEISIWGD